MIKHIKALIRKIRLWLYRTKVVNTLTVKENNQWDKLHNYIVNYEGKIYPKTRSRNFYDRDEDLVYEMIIPFNDYELSFSKKEIEYKIKGLYKDQVISKYLPKDVDFYFNIMRLKLAKIEAMADMEKEKQEEKSHIQTLFGGIK